MGIINDYCGTLPQPLYGARSLTPEEREKMIADRAAAEKAFQKNCALNVIKNIAEKLFFEKGYNVKKAFKMATEFYEESRRLEENWE